jgi:hypothetical protein
MFGISISPTISAIIQIGAGLVTWGMTVDWNTLLPGSAGAKVATTFGFLGGLLHLFSSSAPGPLAANPPPGQALPSK